MRQRPDIAKRIDSPWATSRQEERERQRGLKRDAVILAAARAFKARGYHNTSLDDIAALLQVTKPTLYYYVANKEEMLFECFRAGLGRIASVFAEFRDAKATGRERLLAVIRRYAEAITSEFGWCMVRAESQDLSPQMSARIRALKSGIDQGIRKIISEGIADGSIRPCDPKITAFALAGALNWIALWYRESEELTAAQIADRFIETFECGLKPEKAVS